VVNDSRVQYVFPDHLLRTPRVTADITQIAYCVAALFAPVNRSHFNEPGSISLLDQTIQSQMILVSQVRERGESDRGHGSPSGSLHERNGPELDWSVEHCD